MLYRPQCEKDMEAARMKIKKAIEKGNLEGARIYGQVGRVRARRHPHVP